MFLPTSYRTLASATLVFIVTYLRAGAAPTAVNDSYNLVEDSSLNTNGATLLSSGFEGVQPTAGTWDYLDRLRNDQNGQTPDPYPVDGASRNWKHVSFNTATSTIGPWKSAALPVAGGVIDYFANNSIPVNGVLEGVSVAGAPYGVSTYLFRKTFTLTAAEATQADWRLRYVMDDGIIVYLNEQQVYEENMGPSEFVPAGPLATTTVTSLNGAETQEFTADLNLTGLLVPGTNVLAVEVHQVHGGNYVSTDAGLNLQLEPLGLSTAGFNYVLDTFGTTNGTNYSSGSALTTGGNPSGALQMIMRKPGGFSQNRNISGGWRRTVTMPAAGTMRVQVQARLRLINGFEATEYCQAILDVDGSRYGTAGTGGNVLIETFGQGNTVPDIISPWQSYSFDLNLTAGTHTITMGGFTNRPTDATETCEVYFDNVNIQVLGTGGTVLTNDTGGAVTAERLTSPAHGSVSFNADGSFSYTPVLNYFGPDSFTYRALDAASAPSNTATVNLTVTSLNDAPVGGPDSYSTNQGVTLTRTAANGVLINDTDVDNTPAQLSAQIVTSTPAAEGSLTLNTNGSFTFVPAASFFGQTTFIYRVSDGSALSNPVTATITVNEVGAPPTAVNDSYTTAKNAPLVVTALVESQLTDDLIPFAAPAWKYKDDGSDQGTAWRATGFNDTAWLPGAAELGYGDADEVTVVEGGPAGERFPSTYFRKGFTVADRHTITDLELALRYDDAGVVYLNGVEAVRTSNLDPAPVDIPFDAYASTWGGFSNDNQTDTFVLPLTAIDDAANMAAVQIIQFNGTSTDISMDLRLRALRRVPAGVLANDTDPNPGNTLSIQSNTNPLHGSLSMNANGTFTYTPANGYIGPDSFTYVARDNTSLTSNTATVNLTVVSGPNVRPVANANTYPVTEDVPLTVNALTGVLSNDSDADGDSMSAVRVAGPSNGGLTLNANGSFTYTPNLNFAGADSFTYSANDFAGPSVPATVTLNVTNTNDPPVAVNDLYATDPGTSLNVAAPGVMTNDSDPDAGATLTVQIGTAPPPAQGTLTLNPNGSFLFVPAAGFLGNSSFTYRVSDGTVTSGLATVTVRINARPVANANSYPATEDTPLTISAPGVLANDTDPENDPLTAILVTQAAHGSVTLHPNGGFTFAPQANYHGADSFTYKANDGARDSLTNATVTLTIASVNDAPAAAPDVYAAALNTTLSVPAANGVLLNDSDVDLQPLTAVVDTGVSHGTLNLNADGSFTYTPVNGYAGPDSFTYHATDGTLSSVSTTVSITVGIDLNRVAINEIHYHPGSLNAAHEFIEVFNGNSGPLDVSGWQFDAGITFTLPAGTVIAANGYLVVSANPAQFTAAFGSVSLLRGPWVGELSNSGERLRLITSSGVIVHEIDFADEGDWAERRLLNQGGETGPSWYTRADAQGSSLELINATLSNQNGANWTWSTAAPTPGNVNSARNANIAPLIADVEHKPAIPMATQPVTITADVTDESLTVAPTVRLFWRPSTSTGATSTSGPFTQADMFDDGLHGDGDAGDGEFGATVPAMANGAVVEFYVSATDGSSLTRSYPPPIRNLASALVQEANAFYQVDEEVWTNSYPIYRLISTAADRELYLGGAWDRNSDAPINVTLVSQHGNETEIRYRCDVRVRGAGSRGNPVNNWRLDIPADHPWNGESKANLNIWHPHLGELASKMMECAGLIHERSWPVQVRLNGVNRALSNSAYSGGYYVHLQPPGSEYLDETRPEDDQGNLYKKGRPHQDWSLHEASPGGPPNISGYVNDGWIKQSNEDLNDWNDLHNFMRVFGSGSTPTVAQMESVAHVDYFLRWFAFQAITNHNETNLSNGANDDYGMYRGAIDPRFIPLAHDFDTVWGDGGNTSGLDPTSPVATIYQATGNFSSGETIPAVGPLYTNPVTNQRYKAHLVDLLNTIFLPANFDAMVDATLGNWTGPTAAYGVPAAKRTAIKSFNAQRRTHILQTVLGYSAGNQPPAALTVSSSLTVSNGYPRTTTANVTGLSGTVDSSRVQKLRLNGTDVFPDNYNNQGGGEGGSGVSPWSAGTALTLRPGINQVAVHALGANDTIIGTQTIALWYDDATVQAVAAITGNTTWTAASGPYRVTANLTIDNETLTIEPGSTVYLAAGISLNVSGTGRILAEGTADAPIRFVREPGLAPKWGKVSISGSTLETRLAWVTIDGSGTSPAIELTNAIGYFDHLDFANVTTQYFGSTNSSFLFSNSNFPVAAGVRAAGGTGIPAAGYAVFRGNTFGGTTGLNDLIEFTGGQRPNAILQVLDNTFLAGGDDALDLDGTDAHVEGNVFMNVHQSTAGSDMSAAIAGGASGGSASEITIARNLFWNCDHAILSTTGSFFTVENNTIVNINNAGSAAGSSAAAFGFNEPGRAGVTPALGVYLDGNIVSGSTVVFENTAGVTANLGANRNMLPSAPPPPVTGVGNLTTDPKLTGTTGITASNIRSQYALRSGSPAMASGPNGLDRGGLVPAGASISGEPIAVPPAAAVVLTIGGPGIVQYRYSLDGGPFNAATATATPVTLSGLAAGPHSIRVIGRNSAGVWQDQAAATVSRTWTVDPAARPIVLHEILANNVNAYPVGALRPDYIELRNLSAAPVNLGGWSISDDSITAERGPKYIFSPGTMVPGNGYLLLTTDALGFNLDRDADQLFLYSGSIFGAALIDSVSFGFQVADKSLGRAPGTMAWTLTEPTPNAANVLTELGGPGGIRINEWSGNNEFIVESDFVELYNTAALPAMLTGLVLTDDAINYPQLSPVAPLSFIGGSGFVRFIADGTSGADHVTFSVSRLREGISLLDSAGVVIDKIMSIPLSEDVTQGRTTDGAASFSLFGPGAGFANLPTPGFSNGTNLTAQQLIMDSLRITELMFNPAGGANAPEYIELRNIGVQTIDLSSVKFTNGITFQFAPGTMLAPGAFTVITSAAQSAYLAQYPGAPYGGTYTGRLDNNGERVRMEIDVYQLGVLDFEYSDGWYPITDGGGAALEIVNALAARNTWGEKASWRPTAANPGTDGVFGVVAGDEAVVCLPSALTIEGLITYGSQNPAAVTLAWTRVSGPGTVNFNPPNADVTSATFSTTGTYILRLTATGTATVSDTITVFAQETYGTWAARTISNPAMRGILQDPDSDGLSNLVEFGLGTNPVNGVLSGMPVAVISGGLLNLTYNRYAGCGLSYTVEVSDNLLSWSSDNITEVMTGSTGNLQTWVATDSRPVSAGQKRYLRVRITESP